MYIGCIYVYMDVCIWNVYGCVYMSTEEKEGGRDGRRRERGGRDVLKTRTHTRREVGNTMVPKILRKSSAIMHEEAAILQKCSHGCPETV